jgi:hypothetical protein
MLYYISLALEVAIIVIGLRMAFVKKQYAGAGLAFSFTLYVVYNLAKTFGWGMSERLLDGIFFVATLTIFLVVISWSRRR